MTSVNACAKVLLGIQYVAETNLTLRYSYTTLTIGVNLMRSAFFLYYSIRNRREIEFNLNKNQAGKEWSRHTTEAARKKYRQEQRVVKQLIKLHK